MEIVYLLTLEAVSYTHLDVYKRQVHADAIMDRIIHNSITINAGDVNMREVTSNMNKE